MICLAALAAALVLNDTSNARSSSSKKEPPAAVPETSILYIKPPESPEEKTAAAMEFLDGFFEIKDPASRLPLLFDPVSESEAFLDYFIQQGRGDPVGIHDRKITAVLDKDREILIVTFKDAQKRTWAAPLEWRSDGYRLHWGSMTGYGDIPWDRFLSDQSAKPVQMRVNIYIPDTESPNLIPSDHTFVLLTHPELVKPMGALLSRASSLLPLLELPRNTDIPANVSMQWREFEGTGNWPVITGLIHRNWIR